MPSMRMILLMSALALSPAPLQAQSAADAPMQRAALEPSNSVLDVPIEEIAASVSGCAILDKDFPRLRSHPMYGFFKAMSLNQIAAMSRGKITPDMLAQARTDLSALSFKPIAQNVQQTDFDDPPPARRDNHASLSGSRPK